jgi:hypothetical protein
MCVCVCVCMHVRMCVCLCVCAYYVCVCFDLKKEVRESKILGATCPPLTRAEA